MGRIRMWILQRMIGTAESLELNEITQVVLHRYRVLFDQEEVVFMSLPKFDRQERERILRAILALEAEHG